MALFSKEYLEKNNISLPADFSLENTFYSMKDQTKVSIICEGFGVVQMINRDDECILILIDGMEVSYEDLTGRPIKEKDGFLGFVQLGALVVIAWMIVNLITWFYVAKYEKDYSSENVFTVVNSLFSGLALAGIIYTIALQKKELKLQRKELKLTREELKLTREEFSTQNDTLKLQRFENTFFQMLTLHHQIVDKIQHSGATGRDVFNRASEELEKLMASSQSARMRALSSLRFDNNNKPYDINEAHSTLQKTYLRLYETLETNLSHYYRNLFYIFKFVHDSNLTIPEKHHYTTILRSQLSHGEFHLIFYNCLTDNLGNPNFLFLVKEYNIMKSFGRHQVNDLLFHNEIFDTLSNKITADSFYQEESKPITV